MTPPATGGPVRVLLVVASSERGGAERGVVTLAQGLDRGRFEPWIACHGSGPMFDEYAAAAAGVRSFDLQVRPRAVRALARFMRELGCAVVHSHLWTADLLGGLAALWARVPVRIATVRGEYFRAGDVAGLRRARRGLLSRSFRAVYRLFDPVLAVSGSVAADLAERTGWRVPAGQIRVVPNGLAAARLAGARPVDREALGVSASAPLLACVANLFPVKGQRFLLAALPAVLRERPDAVLVLAGEGPEAVPLARQAAALGVTGSVRFLGSRPDALDMIAASDVVVLPSLSEGLPHVLLEALVLGRAVVATRAGGVPELIEDGVSGVLVPPGDALALAQALLDLIADATRRAALGERGRARVLRDFTAEALVRRVEHVYRERLAAWDRRSVAVP